MKSKKNYKVIISASSKADIKENAEWYNKKQKGLGKRFAQSIKECIRTIQIQPKSFQIRYKNNRVALPQTFPYLIVYDIHSNKKIIIIIAVFHSSQNPEKWKIRV